MELMLYLISNQQTQRISIISNHSKMVDLILLSLRRKILFGLLKRILIQTSPVWRAHELEGFGTSLWRRLTLLKLRKGHCLATQYAQRRPKKRFQNRISFAPRNLREPQKQALCTKFLPQSLFRPLDQERRRRNLKVKRSNAALAIQNLPKFP